MQSHDPSPRERMWLRAISEVGVSVTTNQWDNDDDDSADDGGQQRSRGNSLRDKLESALAENKTLKERVDKAEATAREATVSTLVKEKNLDVKVVKLMPKDIEPTREAIDAWLEEFGDLFTVKADDDTDDDTSQAGGDGDLLDEDSQSYAAAMRQIQGVQATGAAPVKMSDILSKLQDPNLTRDDLMSMISAAGGGAGTG